MAGVVNVLTFALPAATIASGFAVSKLHAGSVPSVLLVASAAWRPRKTYARVPA